MAQAKTGNITRLSPRGASDETFAGAFRDMEDELNQLHTFARLHRMAAEADDLECMVVSAHMLCDMIEEFHELWNGVHKTGKWAGMANAA